jgi:hypothetical protein
MDAGVFLLLAWGVGRDVLFAGGMWITLSGLRKRERRVGVCEMGRVVSTAACHGYSARG